jgi:predicted RNA methylase
MTIRGANYKRRKLDDYPTPPEVTRTLFDNVKFSRAVFDPACGKRNLIVEVARKKGKRAYGRDIAKGGHDFLTHEYQLARGMDIVTNPPYGDRRGTSALRFIERALELTKRDRNRVAMLLPIDFDSGKTRAHVFQHPAFAIKLVLLDRIKWFDGQSGSTNHAWFIWDWKHKGPPVIRYARIKS